ncbi:hypothetical protein DL96DRAFT_1598534, partial [Flagelloscypha sp. PMI_526]
MDTDTLIALVHSLLDTPAPQDAILDALISNDGDVEATARALNGQDTPNTGTKRKRTGSLNDLSYPKSELDSPSRLRQKPQSSSSESSHAKPLVNLLDVLRHPPSKASGPQRLPPLTLTNPSMVSQNTPCTLHYSVLPPDLACSLFYTMCRESQTWKRNKWWLFDRVVESPHLTSFWARRTDGIDSNEEWQKAARHWYNGRPTDAPKLFPPDLEAACLIVEKVVNDELRKRQRLPLEWAGGGITGDWRANGDESVGFHSDQLTGIGPYCHNCLHISWCNKEIYEKDKRAARTFNVPLPHNSERFKHSVPPQPTIDLYHPPFPPPNEFGLKMADLERTRINITLRFYRPDFHPDTIPVYMKNHSDGKEDRYWWSCYAGAQNEGKGCNFWELMDFDKEGRGPAVRTVIQAG